MLQSRKAGLKYGAKLIISHVAGLRMVSQGTYGLSRVNKREGVILGIGMMMFCQWNKLALQAQLKLKDWI